MLYKRILLLCLAMILFLTGCHAPPLYNQTEGNVADAVQRANDARLKSDASGKTLPPLVVNQGLYVDRTPINLAREPVWVRNHIVIRGDQLPFSYFSRTLTGETGHTVYTHYQVGLDQAVMVSMNYSGTVRGALDLLAAKSGYIYTISDNRVYWQSFVTKTFDIAFMAGTADYTLGDSSNTSGASGGGGGGGGGASGGGSTGVGGGGGLSGLNSSSLLKGTISVWKDLEDTIKTMLSPDGKVLVSQSTTSVTVRDRPTNVALICQYIHNLNKSLSRQVLVKIQVLEIDLTTAFNYGLNWQIIKRAFFGTNFVLNANYGTPVSISPLTTSSSFTRSGFTVPVQGGEPTTGILNSDPNHITGINVLVTALEQQGRVSVVSEPRVVCLNNQVSVINIVDKTGYAASVSSTALAGGASGTGSSVTSSITPGTVVTGLILYILPKIMGNKVFLQVNADLSTLLKIDQFTSGAGTGSSASIQTPHTTEKEFNQRSVIGSGDTLILSGFRRIANNVGAMQLFGYQVLGGKGATEANSETVVLITPIILDRTI